MENNIEELFEKLKCYLNDDEKNNCGLYIFTPKGFTEYKSYYKKETLSLGVKIKENRKKTIIQVLKQLISNYKITNDNKYYAVIEINKDKNYIILDYVVNSHIIIPNSFLEHFGYRTQDGIRIDYIDINEKSIKNEKTKRYKTQYGYYSKLIEDILNQEFESKITIITKELHDFRNQKNINLILDKDKIEVMHNFFDVTTYRNIDVLNQVNRESLSSVLVGEYTHNQLMEFIFRNEFPHVYKDLKFNIIINKTDRDFVINDSMISSINGDGGNEIIIMPMNKKECLALMKEDYYKKYVKDGILYYMNIENDNDIEMINRYICRYAKEKKENIIGTRNELEILLKKEMHKNV